MSEEKQNHFIQIVRGFPFPFFNGFTVKNIEDAMDLVPEDDDIIIATYPKTGTTWMQYIVLQILSKGEHFPSFGDATFKVVPYIEMVGVAAVHAQKKPRCYKHHIAYNFVQKNAKSKIIYAYRNPEDTVVSYYHFLINMGLMQIDFSQFFENFVSGKIGYGNYFQHVLSFYEHRNDDNLLMVSYEKLHANRKEEILRIAKFLGEKYYQCLQEDEELLDKILLHTSFNYMKKNLTLIHPDVAAGVQKDPAEDKFTANFFRKGIVGDGKATLSDNQRQILREAAVKVLKGTSIISEWYCDEN